VLNATTTLIPVNAATEQHTYALYDSNGNMTSHPNRCTQQLPL
jgi:hypothetical protein